MRHLSTNPKGNDEPQDWLYASSPARDSNLGPENSKPDTQTPLYSVYVRDISFFHNSSLASLSFYSQVVPHGHRGLVGGKRRTFLTHDILPKYFTSPTARLTGVTRHNFLRTREHRQVQIVITQFTINALVGPHDKAKNIGLIFNN